MAGFVRATSASPPLALCAFLLSSLVSRCLERSTIHVRGARARAWGERLACGCDARVCVCAMCSACAVHYVQAPMVVGEKILCTVQAVIHMFRVVHMLASGHT